MKKQILAWLLAAAVSVICTGRAAAASSAPTGEAGSVGPDEDRLTISILGDSNSGYHGWSDGAAADTTNSTIRDSNTYFEESDIAVEDMWWYIAAKELGAEILVNNSWSGSCVLSENEPYASAGTEGWNDRCVNLHDDTGPNAGEEPDIIVIFLGTDDVTFHWETLGYPAAVNHAALIRETDSGIEYRTPRTSAEAYAVMLDRITRRYPDADIYCMTVLPRRDADFLQRLGVQMMNDIIITEADRYGAAVADIWRDSGITSDIADFDRYMMDLLHPNEAGMKRIAAVFVSAVRGVPVPEPDPAAAKQNDGDPVTISSIPPGIAEAF